MKRLNVEKVIPESKRLAYEMQGYEEIKDENSELEKLSKADLVKMLEERGIQFNKKMNKDELLALLND